MEAVLPGPNQPGARVGPVLRAPGISKNFSPLLLLWKGIGQYLIRNPQYKLLFGPVSISNGYTAASRHLMVKFLSAYRQSPELTPLVRARNPFRQRPSKLADDLDRRDGLGCRGAFRD